MKRRWMFCVFVLCAVIATGCSSNATKKPSDSAGLDIESMEDSDTPAAESSAGNGEDGSNGDDSNNTLQSNNGNDSNNMDENGNENNITMETAKETALKKAGLTEKDGDWTKEKLDHDDGRAVYELEFVSGKLEYDFEIDAENGNILEYEKDSAHD